MEYPIESSKKKVGVPPKELLSLRHSEDIEDIYFIEYLKSQIKEKQGELTSQEKTRLIELEKEKEESKKKFILDIDKYSLAREAMEKLFDKGELYSAAQIALALGDCTSAKKAMEKLFDKRYLHLATKIAIVLAKKYPASVKEAIEKCFNERCLDSAGEIAVALAEKDPASAKEAMERLFDKGELYSAGEIAIALAEKDPASAKKAMERLFGKGKSDLAAQIALALGDCTSAKEAMEKLFDIKAPNYAAQIALALAESIDFSRVSTFENILDKHNVPQNSKLFSYISIRNRLALKEDLGGVILEDLPDFQAIKEYSFKINSDLPEDKQSSDLEKFWNEHQMAIANLLNIHPQLGKGLVLQKIQQFGFPRLEKTLALLDYLTSEKIVILKKLVQNTNNPDPHYLEKIIELTDAFQRFYLDKEFNELTSELIQKSQSPQEVIIALSKKLLSSFAQKIGINAEVSENAFAKWNLPYLSKLFFAERSFEEESREALKLILKAALQDDFNAIINHKPFSQKKYTKEELKLIEEIQEHNLQVKAEFEKAGIDYDTWLHYSPQKEFSVGIPQNEVEKRISSFERELSEIIINLLGSRKENRPGILSEEKAKEFFKTVFKKYGLKFEEGQITGSKGKLSPLDLQNPLQETIDFLKKELAENPREALGTNINHLENILKALPDLQKEMKQKGYTFQIKLWDREPGYDIFQGNYTHCCIAVENFNRAAILDYLSDTGMNIIEIRDKNTGEVIAQTFVFMAQNEEGENIMVLDNIEVNNDYRGVADDIRKNLFEYVADFGDHIIKDPKRKINTVLLGTNYNDVETRDLPHIKTTIKKIGGAGVSGTQYLDSFGSAWVDSSKFTHREFFVAMDDLREKSIKSKKDFEKRITKPEIISKLDKRTIKEIVKVEEASFPFEMQSDEENLLKTLKNENGIHIVLRNSQGEVVGYLSSLPQKDAYEDLKDWDDKMQPEEKALYVESIAIEPEYRDVKNLLSLGKSLIEEAKKRGFRKITMHARVASDLSSVLQKRYGAKFLYRIENWHNFQEPFDYLEIEVKS